MTTPLTTTRAAIVAHSIDVILAGQAASGAYVACPRYPTYRFAWLRDGSFCADAVDRHGERGSAAAFHAWVCRTILQMSGRVEGVTRTAASAEPHRMLPTRFETDGSIESGEEGWPNFQLDGYGTWLWAFGQHVRRRGLPPTPEEDAAVRLVADYVAAAGDRACYDCWEESLERRHAATIAASVGGLRAASDLVGVPSYDVAADRLTEVLGRDFVRDGSFVKHDDTDLIDASLLWLCLPFGVLAPDDPRFVATAARVDSELRDPTGGVRRYLGDTYYGGGAWLLLTAWNGWAHHAAGRSDLAEEHLRWVEERAEVSLDMPEQVLDHPQAPDRVQEWVERWGPVATPLLWSHAMYLTLVDETGADR